jgi:hypothetical protein
VSCLVVREGAAWSTRNMLNSPEERNTASWKWFALLGGDWSSESAVMCTVPCRWGVQRKTWVSDESACTRAIVGTVEGAVDAVMVSGPASRICVCCSGGWDEVNPVAVTGICIGV